MIDFMIIGFPRSGTTFAANWLNSGATFCAHDPLWHTHYIDLDAAIEARAPGKIGGIACTGLWRWPHWVNAHPARKLILRRSIKQSRDALARLGLPPLTNSDVLALNRIDGISVPYEALFDEAWAEMIWNYLTGARVAFDRERHRELRTMRIETNFDAVHRDFELNNRLSMELRQ